MRLSLLPALLLLLQLSLVLPSVSASNLATISFGSSAPPLTAALDPTSRIVRFTQSGSAGGDASPDDATQEPDRQWKPLQLAVDGPVPSAMGAGAVRSAPALLRPYPASSSAPSTLSTSTAMPFLVVASQRIVRLYAPKSMAPNAPPMLAREFSRQPLLLSESGELVMETRGLLCACRIHVADGSPAPTATSGGAPSSLPTGVYISDSFGRLSVLYLNESRITTQAGGGSAAGGKAWMVRQDRSLLVQPPGLLDDGLTGDCPPCDGGAIFTANATSSVLTPRSPGLFYAPRAGVVMTSMIDANADGRLDYLVVQASTSRTVLPLVFKMPSNDSTIAQQRELQARSVLGMQVQLWINNATDTGASQSQSQERFVLVADTVVSGSDDSNFGVSAEEALAASQLDEPTAAPAINELSAASPPSRRRSQNARPSRPRFFAAALAPPQSQQLFRVPMSIAAGYFNGDARLDIVVAVTDFVNRSSLASEWPIPPGSDGVLVQRRLVTLFGAEATDTTHLRFDPRPGQGSVSEAIEGSEVFLPGVGLLAPPALASASTSASASASASAAAAVSAAAAASLSAPLLTSVISLLDENDSEGDGYNITSLDRSMLRPLALLGSPTVQSLGFDPFPFQLLVLQSPFYNNESSSLQTHQLSSVAMVAQGFAQSQGRVQNLRCDRLGQWIVRRSETDAAASEGDVAESLDQRLDAFGTDDAVYSGLGDDPVQRPVTFLPALHTGSHPVAAFSSLSDLPTFQGTSHDLSIKVHEVSLAPDTQARVDSDVQMLYTPVIPAVQARLPSDTAAPAASSGSSSPSAPSVDGGPRVSSAHIMLLHNLQVAEYLRGGTGWMEGLRVRAMGIVMEEGPQQPISAWKKFILSPVTWTFLALLALVAFFLLWLLYRARGRWLNAHQVHVRDEVAAVMAAGANLPMPVFDLEDDPEAQARAGMPSPPVIVPRAGRFGGQLESEDGSSSSSPPLNPQQQPQLPRSQAPLAPPNTAALPGSSSPCADPSVSPGPVSVGVGSLLPIPPRIELETAVATSTAPPSAAMPAQELSGESSLASSPASSVTPPHPQPQPQPHPHAAAAAGTWMSATSPMSSPSPAAAALPPPPPPLHASPASFHSSPVVLSHSDWNSSSPVAITYTPHAAADADAMLRPSHSSPPPSSSPPPRARGARAPRNRAQEDES